jgi:hypothetical protein
MIAVGSKVYLRGCAFGKPGTVLRIERRKVVVFWHDLDYLARNSPESLMLAERNFSESGALPDARQEASGRDSESTRDFHDIEQAKVSLSTLDSANVRPVKIGFFRKPLLR